MRFRDDNDSVDWNRVFKELANPKKDENGNEYIDCTDKEKEEIEKYCAFLLTWRFKERPDLPLVMQQKQDAAFKELCRKSFAYLEPK